MTVLAGQVLTADDINNLDLSGTYTPALTASTDPNLGADGQAVGTWHRNGHELSVWVRFWFSGTGVSAGSGSYRVSLPFDADTSLMEANENAGLGMLIGGGRAVDISGTGAASENLTVQLASSTTVLLMAHHTNGQVGATVPFGWSDNERLTMYFRYLADPTAL